MPLLRIKLPGKEVVRYEMTEDEVTVGRERGCTVVLAGDSGISKVHSRIKRSGNGFVLTDAGSANGTRLNGKGIGNASARLSNGDRIGVGSTEIVFDDPFSPKRTWLGKMLGALGGLEHPAGTDKTRKTSGGTVFGEGFVTCGKCGTKIHTGSRKPGQKVGCSRCRSVYVIPPR